LQLLQGRYLVFGIANTRQDVIHRLCTDQMRADNYSLCRQHLHPFWTRDPPFARKAEDQPGTSCRTMRSHRT